MMKIFHFNNAQLAAEKLADRIATLLTKAIDERGTATLVVSGGSTPKPMFNALSEHKLDWSKVTVTLADERCVDPDDSASNARLVRQELLINSAAEAHFVQLFDGGELSIEDEERANDLMKQLPKFDVVVLGMGDDGHTASIFPEAKNRDVALDKSGEKLALSVDPVTVTPMRITQTARRLLDTKLLVLHSAGEGKARLFGEILREPDPKKRPISAFITQDSVPLEVYQSYPRSPEQASNQTANTGTAQ